MNELLSLLSGILMVLGSLLAMLAGLGVLRFPDTLSRLQAATKLQAAGVGIVVAAAALVAEDGGELAVLTPIFAPVGTAPASVHDRSWP